MYKKSLIGDIIVFTLFLSIFSITLDENFSLLYFMILLITSLFLRNILVAYFPKWSNTTTAKKTEYSTLTFFVIVFGNAIHTLNVSNAFTLFLFFLIYEINKFLVYKFKSQSESTG
ncbi:hypothetical protein AX762_11770 [Alkalibacterium sp. 20]|nr:hypothetical protein AX762_11770 [Alkalibacterium sp. 20]